MKLLAVAATDSHLKWAVHLLAGAPPAWDSDVVVLDGTTAPSPRQIAAATASAGPAVPRSVSIGDLGRMSDSYDVMLLACPGPVIAAIDTVALRRSTRRPVIVAGTPGIALPARRRAVLSRRGVDVFIVHSLTERRAYESVIRSVGTATRVALASLPTLEPVARSTDRDGGVVFAPQALVPSRRDDRRRLLKALTAASGGDLAIHERTMAGEQTAHREVHPYRGIWNELVATGRFAPNLVRFVDGPMQESLAGARSLVTVSSTAALEAIAAGVPIGIVADFGVGDDTLNSVFAESRCLVRVTADGLVDVGLPPPAWRDEHYFHAADRNDWIDRVEAAVRKPDRHRRAAAPSSWWPAAKWLVRSSSTGRASNRTVLVERATDGSTRGGAIAR